jgi:probable O-glycosylation ligase (exosortase A-associated)
MNETIRPRRATSAATDEEPSKVPHAPAVPLSRPLKTSLGAPFWLLVAYFIIDYVRPQDRFPFLGPLKLGMITSILLLLTWLAKGDKSILKEPVIVLYGLFILLAASTVVFARNTFWVYETTRTLTIYLLAATLPSIAFLNTREKILKFFNIWIIIHVWLAWVSIGHAGKGSGSFLADENDWALALNMSVPYAFFLSQSPYCSKLARALYLAAFAILILAIAATLSRGGFIGLAVVMAGLLYFSRQRIRKLLLLIVMAAILLPFVPGRYFHEIETISNPNDATREDRLYSWRRGWEMFLDNPILGVGAGNYPWTVSHYELRSAEYDEEKIRLHGGRVAHSLYFTLVPELGSVGTLIYCAIVILVIRKLVRLGRLGRSHKPQDEKLTDLELLARAMLVSLLAYFVTGAFISVLYYPHVWYLIGFLLAIEHVSGAEVAGTKGNGNQLPANFSPAPRVAPSGAVRPPLRSL